MVVETIENETFKSEFGSSAMNISNSDHWSIAADHCYARPWDWRPETTFLRPTKSLFMNRSFKRTPSLAPLQEKCDNIDVESIDDEPTPIYDTVRAKQMSEECERHAALARYDEVDDDWQDSVSKFNWTPTQHKIFNGMVNILNSDRLGRLTCLNLPFEAVTRRTIIDKSVQRVRRLMTMVSWDSKITQWIYQLLIDVLNKEYLAIFLDILQTLKYKLPTFVDKMMFGPISSTKMGVLSNDSLFPLLKKPWDPVMPSLMQDKPKKLPGNPVILIIPSTSLSSSRNLKWMNTLSNLATVVNVPYNFGSSSQRMSLVHSADQMFVSIRGKIQEMKSDYPNRNVILMGFGAGATMALQVAQVENVLCVVSIGFSLLTAEGKRGEPDDSLLELQCPVLFVIGQCSSATSQEDLEDLREHMRVETGLIVVGSADNNLKVSKKLKRAEGITQSVVDRNIIDEIGEFVSNIILSPYPPQIRQSPTSMAAESILSKKARMERKRYSSNASSLDSEEPPSPTPTRISRPVGRPPGSKSKSKLEAKWAAQVAQGIPSKPPSPSPNNSPIHTPFTPDTSSNDSTHTDKSFIKFSNTTEPPPVKKIKTLKPVFPSSPLISDKSGKMSRSPGSSSAKLQAYGLAKRNITTGPHLSTLLQGGIKTIPPSQPKSAASTIKVLENVTLNNSLSSKYITNSGRSFDLSKLSEWSSGSSIKSSGTTLGNVVLLPDGKLKSLTGTLIKTSSGQSIVLPSASNKPSAMASSLPVQSHVGSQGRARYITSKKQLLGNRPPKPVKKVQTYISSGIQNPQTPINLTTQDIMDLPIIFADDNQILDTDIGPDVAPPPQPMQPPPSKLITSTPGSKFVIVNKPLSLQTSTANFVISQAAKKAPSIPKTAPPKFTKIIFSKRNNPDEFKNSTLFSKLTGLPSDITLKRISSSDSSATLSAEHIDLETELVATAVPKPNFGGIRNITILPQKMTAFKPIDGPSKAFDLTLNSDLIKMEPHVPNLPVDDCDSDLFPTKMMKFE